MPITTDDTRGNSAFKFPSATKEQLIQFQRQTSDCDIHISCNGKVVKAHSAILTPTVLPGGCSHQSKDRISVPFGVNEVCAVLSILYTDLRPNDGSNLLALKDVCNSLGLDHLVIRIKEWMRDDLKSLTNLSPPSSDNEELHFDKLYVKTSESSSLNRQTDPIPIKGVLVAGKRLRFSWSQDSDNSAPSTSPTKEEVMDKATSKPSTRKKVTTTTIEMVQGSSSDDSDDDCLIVEEIKGKPNVPTVATKEEVKEPVIPQDDEPMEWEDVASTPMKEPIEPIIPGTPRQARRTLFGPLTPIIKEGTPLKKGDAEIFIVDLESEPFKMPSKPVKRPSTDSYSSSLASVDSVSPTKPKRPSPSTSPPEINEEHCIPLTDIVNKSLSQEQTPSKRIRTKSPAKTTPDKSLSPKPSSSSTQTLSKSVVDIRKYFIASPKKVDTSKNVGTKKKDEKSEGDLLIEELKRLSEESSNLGVSKSPPEVSTGSPATSPPKSPSRQQIVDQLDEILGLNNMSNLSIDDANHVPISHVFDNVSTSDFPISNQPINLTNHQRPTTESVQQTNEVIIPQTQELSPEKRDYPPGTIIPATQELQPQQPGPSQLQSTPVSQSDVSSKPKEPTNMYKLNQRPHVPIVRPNYSPVKANPQFVNPVKHLKTYTRPIAPKPIPTLSGNITIRPAATPLPTTSNINIPNPSQTGQLRFNIVNNRVHVLPPRPPTKERAGLIVASGNLGAAIASLTPGQALILDKDSQAAQQIRAAATATGVVPTTQTPIRLKFTNTNGQPSVTTVSPIIQPSPLRTALAPAVNPINPQPSPLKTALAATPIVPIPETVTPTVPRPATVTPTVPKPPAAKVKCTYCRKLFSSNSINRHKQCCSAKNSLSNVHNKCNSCPWPNGELVTIPHLEEHYHEVHNLQVKLWNK